jgi:hypothetical protein
MIGGKANAVCAEKIDKDELLGHSRRIGEAVCSQRLVRLWETNSRHVQDLPALEIIDGQPFLCGQFMISRMMTWMSAHNGDVAKFNSDLRTVAVYDIRWPFFSFQHFHNCLQQNIDCRTLNGKCGYDGSSFAAILSFFWISHRLLAVS